MLIIPLKEKLISLIESAPRYSDPNYNVEFTKDAELLRDQLTIDIQKEVNKCNNWIFFQSQNY